MKGVAASAAGERDAGTDFPYRLVDQAHGAFAMTALVRRCRLQFAAGRLQHGDAFVHVRLRADRIADTDAGGDSSAEQHGADGRGRHVVSPLTGILKKTGNPGCESATPDLTRHFRFLPDSSGRSPPHR